MSSHNKWASVVTEFQGHSVSSTVLAMPNVAYDLLLSHPDMKKLKINLYWDDKVLVEDEYPRTTKDLTPRPLRVVHCEEDIKATYPELVCIGSYPLEMKSHQVPFEIADKTVVRRAPYNMSREKKTWLKVELQAMLDANIIRPSVSPFASPITTAPKEDETFRLCTDYRALNQQMELIPFPMPKIDTSIDETGGCHWFSRTDLCKDFWQIPLTEYTKKYTSFVTPFDLYEYNRLPFGLKNPPAWLQKIMNDILKPYFGIFCDVYIDNVVIFSKTEKEHQSHLSQVLNALSLAELKVNFKKSFFFFQDKVVFLGRIFDKTRKSAKQDSVERISKLEKPYDIYSL